MRAFLRPLLIALALCAGAGAWAGERTAEALRAVLPKFDPAKSRVARPAEANKVERPTAQEGVTILEDFKVVEKKVEQPDPDQWLTGAEVTRREVRRAEAEMSTLDLLLNRWHIPLLMPSFKDRVRANYEEKKRTEEMERLNDLQRLPGN